MLREEEVLSGGAIEMTEDEGAEFTIVSDDDSGDKIDRPSPGSDVIKTLDKMLDKAKEAAHLKRCMRVMGMTKRIYNEDRDAESLFCNGGRCEIHGIKCTHPCCNVCGFADMQGQNICAVMDNLDRIHETKKNWGLRNDGEESGGDGDTVVSEDIHSDTE